jgi:hypothetical protein
MPDGELAAQIGHTVEAVRLIHEPGVGVWFG